MDNELAPKECLFEAIVNIKRGHNKPNTARICSFLQKKYGITANRSIKAINHYTITGEITAVNPGAPPAGLSYRVVETPPSASTLDDIPSLQGSLVNKFMAELIINEPNYLNDGVPPTRLVTFIEEKQTNLSRKEILEAIRAELSSGNLDTFDNGNYGYNPVDSSDEDPPSEPEDRRPRPTPVSVSSKPKIQAISPPNVVKPIVPVEKATTPRNQGAISRVATQSPPRRERKGPRREDPLVVVVAKENVRKEEGEEKKKPTWKMKKRKCYVEKDDDFTPGSKDFKVDLSLERQSRKRKEKKIFDPSALESKSRRSRNGPAGPGGLKGSPQEIAEPSRFSTYITPLGSRKLISPGKKSVLAGGAKPPGGPSVVPPGGGANITPLVPSTVCYLCQSYGKRIKGVPEKLISCVKCTMSKAHISCMNDARLPTEKLMSSSAVNNWTCKKCLLQCVYCNQEKPGVTILECTGCNSGFHIPCHRSLIPPLCSSSDLTPALFKCVRCVPPQQQASQLALHLTSKVPKPLPRLLEVVEPKKEEVPKVTVTQLKPKVTFAPVVEEVSSPVFAPQKPPPARLFTGRSISPGPKLEDPYAKIPIDESIPDCSRWSANDVHDYLRLYLQPHVCKPLLDGDVDGSALLLLKRSDCIRILGLPLGFGLKLWSHVKRLQTKRSEIEMYWE